MHSFATSVLFLAAIQIGYAGNTEYIEPGSVQCTSTGVYFAFSKDPTKSDLYKDTQLKIDLFTSSKNKKVADADFDITSGKVSLAYKDYKFDATVQYGPDHHALLDNIEQPFYAVPKAGTPNKRNYTFAVYCTVPASYPVTIINKTANMQSDNRLDIINPLHHIAVDIKGLRSSGTAKLGDHLTYTISLKDDTYASLLPVNCKFFNPDKGAQNVPFVSDTCPRIFPPDPDAYFQTMVKKNATSYEINFRAFTFQSATSALGITCDLQLCITQNVDSCSKACWDVPAPTKGTQTLTTEPPTTVTITNYFLVSP